METDSVNARPVYCVNVVWSLQSRYITSVITEITVITEIHSLVHLEHFIRSQTAS